MQTSLTRSESSSRFLSLSISVLCLILAASSAQGQTDLTDVQATGSASLKISVKKGPTLQFTDSVTFGVDNSDMASLNGTVDIEGTVDDSGKKPVLTVTNWSSIEGELEALIDVADPNFSPSTVVINLDKTKVKLTAKLKTDLDLKVQVGFSFTVNGMYAGKFSLKAAAIETRPPPCEGMTFGGIESYKASVKGVGSVGFNEEFATLALNSEETPFDGMISFTYTNIDASPNRTFTGALDFSDKKPVLALDATSIMDLEENLEDLIFDESGLLATVTLGAEKTSFKCGKLGESATIGYSAVFMADFGGGEVRAGKVTVKNKMVPLLSF